MKLFRLADYSEERRSKFIEILDKNLPEPFPDYNDFGLRFPIDHLNQMAGSIVMLPLDYAARYVDKIFKSQVDTNHVEISSAAASIKHGQILKCNDTFMQMNCTAVGNMAYVILNSPDKDIREAFSEFYSAFGDWFMQAVEAMTEVDIQKIATENNMSLEDAKHFLGEGFQMLKQFRTND